MTSVTLPAERRPTADLGPRRGQGWLVGLGILILPPSLVTGAIYLVQPDGDAAAMAASFVAYGLGPCLLSLLLLGVALLRARRRVALGVVTLLVAALTALHVSMVAPELLPDRRPATTEPLTVVSLNVRHGSADPAQVWAQARRADIVVLLEYDGFDPTTIPSDAWAKRFPAAAGLAVGTWSSTVIYSRYPLSDIVQLPASTIAKQWSAVVTTPQLGRVRVMAVHPCNPLCGNGQWADEHATVRAAVAPYLGERLIVAGDFNAVDEHGPMRRLKADGLASATDVAGAGWLPTYPADKPSGLPPLIPIDHILLSRSLTASAVTTFRAEGTDHLGLVATIAGTG